MPESLQYIQKLIAFIIGAIVQLISLGLFHGTALLIASGLVLAATGAGIYTVPNKAKGG